MKNISNDKTNTKYKIILRWLSMLPVAFTALVLSDWAVSFGFWLMRLPIIIFERIFGIGPIGKLMDSITISLLGVDSNETIMIIASGLLSGYMIVYIPATVCPLDKKKTAKILTVIYLFFIGGSYLLLTSYLCLSGWSSFCGLGIFSGKNILLGIFLVIGIVSALHSVKTQTGQENNKHERVVSNNVLIIFISSFLFTVLALLYLR